MVRPTSDLDSGMAVTAGNARHRNASAHYLGAIVDLAVGSHRRAAAVLVVVGCLCFLPGFFVIPPIDRDEARFAQATKQMVESGDYVDIRFQDEVRYKKPVGIYWLQAGIVQSARRLGLSDALTTIWLYRIPSFVGALGAVLLTYWTALAFVPRRSALLAGLLMASSVLLGVEARLAKTDAMLLLCMVAAMGALARVYLPEQRARLGPLASWTMPAVFWTALAGGILLKGPLILMLVGLAIGALAVVDRSARWLLALRPVLGLAWLAVLVLPWFLAIVGRSGGAFFAGSIGEDLFAKVFTGQESHGAPPGYYFALFWVTFWPGAALAGLSAPAIWAARREPGAKFLLAWVLPSWIVFEIVVTKLPHYVLPLYPAIAILIAGIIEARMLWRTRWATLGPMWWFVFAAIAGVAGIVGLMVIGKQLGLAAWPLIGAAVVLGLLAWRLYEADGAERSLLRAVAALVLLAVAHYGVIVPSLAPLFPSATLARIVQESDCPQPQAAAAGYHEPSLVFLVGTATRLTDGSGAADFLHGGDCRFAFIEARYQRSFAQRADAIGLRYSPGPRFDALNVASGRAITIAVYRSRGPS
jgi:4-amino-4-deoxy-L-arabinose transferase-like glycosyltransferase